MIRGNLAVQDSSFIGKNRSFEVGEIDEEGDPVIVSYNPDSPVPPDGDYEKYVLQDVSFEWDDINQPVPEKVRLYWVKKGTAVFFNGEVVGKRGLSVGVYSLFAESKLEIRRNTFSEVETPFFFVLNGAQGKAFRATLENNQIFASNYSTWVSAFFDVGFPLYNPFTDQTLEPDPGEQIIFRKNFIEVGNPDLPWWASAIRYSSYGSLLVEKNQIDLASGIGVIIGWPAAPSIISANSVTGTGNYAFLMDWDAPGNKLITNDLSGFTPNGTGDEDMGTPSGHIMLVSDENIVIGGPDAADQTVWDVGSNNKVVGMTRLTLSK